MAKRSRSKDYYDILGANETSSARDIDRLYKRMAALHHPDKGGTEEAMKSVNEAYSVLKDARARREYDAKRRVARLVQYRPVSAPPAQDIGLFGHFLSAFLCLLLGLFLLILVRVQWFWFLWPLAILSVFVILFGIWMAHSAAVAYKTSLSARNPLRRHFLLRELLFWSIVVTSGYGVYILLTAVE
jgi:DnaJ domain